MSVQACPQHALAAAATSEKRIAHVPPADTCALMVVHMLRHRASEAANCSASVQLCSKDGQMHSHFCQLVSRGFLCFVRWRCGSSETASTTVTVSFLACSKQNH
jgi:hypothetical protein